MIELHAHFTWPDGIWNTWADHVSVHGSAHHIEATADFLAGANLALDAEEAFGVRIKRDPRNAHDSYAIQVIGFWKVDGREERRLLGFVPRLMAYRIGHELAGSRLGACLVGWESGEGDENRLFINVLTPDT